MLDRTHRSVVLTDAGSPMLGEARRVLAQAGVARAAARHANDRAVARMRLGYPPDSLPGSVARAMRLLARDVPGVEIQLETGRALRLAEDVRAGRLDVAVVGVPTPTLGLRVTSAGREGVVVALRVTHPQALHRPTSLVHLAPERLLLLPPEVNPAHYRALTAICHGAGLSLTLVEVRQPRIEDVLLGVAVGAGMALLPESVATRHATPGVRFVALGPDPRTLGSAVLTQQEPHNVETRGFLHALSRALEDLPAVQSGRVIPLAA